MRAAQDVDVLSDAPAERPRPLMVALAVAAVVVAFDQATKAWAVATLGDGPCSASEDACIDLFWTARFNLVYNRGASFSTGTEFGPVFGVVAFGMALFLLYLAKTRTDRLGPVVLGAITGGAVGNLIDRIARAEDGFLQGAVVDFIDFQWWPVFNVADSAVVVGVIVFIVMSLLEPVPASNEAEASDADDEEASDEAAPDADDDEAEASHDEVEGSHDEVEGSPDEAAEACETVDDEIAGSG